jgi:1-acyl-sn-glycerol-3-phosphate acyltransferase
MEILSFLRALFIIDPLIYLYTFVCGAVSLVGSLFDSTGRFQHGCARVWSVLILGTGGIRVRAEGLENVDTSRPHVFCSNHLSLMDSPVLLIHVPVPFRIMAKKNLFNLPFLGWWLRRSGHMPVDRSSPKAAMHSLQIAAARVREGASVVFFPEGTRSRTGVTADFKRGAALLAIQAGVPLLPVAIRGTREVLKPDTLHVRPGKVTVRFGAPIPTAGMTHRDAGRLIELTRERILEMLNGNHGNDGKYDPMTPILPITPIPPITK